MANIGDSFHILSGLKDHLHFVVWGPGLVPFKGAGDQLILASIASIVPQHDTACEVQVGEHPFVTRPSYVFYREIKTIPPAYVASMVQNGFWKPDKPASSQLVDRIRAGFCTSVTVDRRYRRVLGCPNPPSPPP